MRKQLLDWYGASRRELPWRETKEPYCIWVSEIMLQQTRVAVVVERYTAFLERFPTVGALARASEDEVLALWSGLGYYRRARMLHQGARFVVEHLGGTVPARAGELIKLPGVGSYTAAAIASIAHGERVAVVDGNVERVICRLAGLDASEGRATELRRRVQEMADELVDAKQPGDFNQAMMELGATVCLPRNPQCLVCPVAAHCTTRGEHRTATRPPMQSRTVVHALCVREGRSGRKVLLEQRPATETVMPGMWELPPLYEAEGQAERLRMTVRHAIMQVNYSVQVQTWPEEELPEARPGRKRRWVALPDLPSKALTGLARKVLMRAHLMESAKRQAAREPGMARL